VRAGQLRHLLGNRNFILVVVTVLLLILIGLSSQIESINQLGNLLSIPLNPLQKAFTFLGDKLDDFVTFFKDTRSMKLENEILRERVKILEEENRELRKYRDEINELREALNLKGRFDDYEMVGANVIAKDPGNWFNYFLVDVGTSSGIETDCAVLTGGRGLVGRVAQSHLTSSKIMTIIGEDSVVSGWIQEKGGNVRVKGDITLKDDGLCRMDYIPLDVDVEVGDIVETSGLGGIYPRGILIGRVIEVRHINSEFNRYAIIEPAVDFKNLDKVYILRRKDASLQADSAAK